MRGLVLICWFPLWACGFESGGTLELDPPTPPESEEPGPDLGGGGPGPGSAGGGQRDYYASSEETRRGLPISGSYLDSHALDGRVESIRSELDDDDEKLEHRWYFEELPEGRYEIELVGLSRSSDEVVSLSVDYAIDAGKGHTTLFAIAANGLTTSYLGTFLLGEASTLEIRVRLPKNVEAEDDSLSVLEIDFLRISTAP